MSKDISLPVVLTIAGSDNTGGAGIQADIKAAIACNVYPSTVITAVTAQSNKGLRSIEYVGRKMLLDQLETVFECLKPDAVKIGLIPNAESAILIANFLKSKCQRNIVLDTVLGATAGGNFNGNDSQREETINAIKENLFPITTLITPNIPELRILARSDQKNQNLNMLVEKIFDLYNFRSLLLKGGHSSALECVDKLYSGKTLIKEYKTARIDTSHSHGTGCVLSMAIACNLAKGNSLEKSIAEAKNLIFKSILSGQKNKVMDIYGPVHPNI